MNLVGYYLKCIDDIKIYLIKKISGFMGFDS